MRFENTRLMRFLSAVKTGASSDTEIAAVDCSCWKRCPHSCTSSASSAAGAIGVRLREMFASSIRATSRMSSISARRSFDFVSASPMAAFCGIVTPPKSPSDNISSVASTEVSGVLRSCTIIFIRSSRTFSSSRSFRRLSSRASVAALSLSRLRTRAPSTNRLCGLVRKSSPPASMPRTRSLVSLSAVTKITGMRAVRGSRLIRRQTSKPVDRSSTPRSPAGIATSRMQRSGCASKATATAEGPSDAVIVSYPRLPSWSRRSSTLAGISSATSISSGLALPPSAISGRHSEAEAENESSLLDVRRTSVRALHREVEGRPVAGQRNSQAGGDGALRDLFAVVAEGQRTKTHSGAQSDDPLHQTGSAHFGADTSVPAVERLHTAARERVQRAPRIVRYPRRDAGAGNAFEHEGGRVMIGNVSRSDQGVAVFRAKLAALSSRECESEGTAGMDLHTRRDREPSVANATGLDATDENRAVRKDVREGDPVAGGEDVPPQPEPKLGSVRKRDGKPHIIDGSEDLVPLGERYSVVLSADMLEALQTGLL